MRHNLLLVIKMACNHVNESCNEKCVLEETKIQTLQIPNSMENPIHCDSQHQSQVLLHLLFVKISPSQYKHTMKLPPTTWTEYELQEEHAAGFSCQSLLKHFLIWKAVPSSESQAGGPRRLVRVAFHIFFSSLFISGESFSVLSDGNMWSITRDSHPF